MENFIEVVRSRKMERLFGPVSEGHVSSALCHLGNISHRIGRNIGPADVTERTQGNSLTAEATGRMVEHLKVHGINLARNPLTLGATLTFDPENERFKSTYADNANELIKRKYRQPFEVPYLSASFVPKL